jgi:hypothetical protein
MCPCPIDIIESYFDSNPKEQQNNDGTEDIWVAVFRSNNNQPSIQLDVREEFFQAMSVATSQQGSSGSSDIMVSSSASPSSTTSPPVAVGRLTLSGTDADGNGTGSGPFLFDSLQCTLKKESMDESCDGGSEYLEAIGVAVDELLLWYLQVQDQERDAESPPAIFQDQIRVKSTLFTHVVFENRGFQEVQTLSRDMATHYSSYRHCLDAYRDRCSSNGGSSSGSSSRTVGSVGGDSRSRDRALQIYTLLGQLDAKIENNAAVVGSNGRRDDADEGGDYDPWANISLRR